ncbi:hypothetical protein EG328_001706, partial [Venturia inaequalis]
MRQGIHWKAPAIMVSSSVFGFAFIFGPPFFNQSLHPDTPTGDAVFEQQANTGIQNVTTALNCSLEARHRMDKYPCQTCWYLSWAPGYSDTSGKFEALNVESSIGALHEGSNDSSCSLFIATSPTIEN